MVNTQEQRDRVKDATRQVVQAAGQSLLKQYTDDELAGLEQDELTWLIKSMLATPVVTYSGSNERQARKKRGEICEAIVTCRLLRKSNRHVANVGYDKWLRDDGFDSVIQRNEIKQWTDNIRHLPDLLMLDGHKPEKLHFVECKNSVTIDRDSYLTCRLVADRGATVYFAVMTTDKQKQTTIKLIDINDLIWIDTQKKPVVEIIDGEPVTLAYATNLAFDDEGWYVDKTGSVGDGSNTPRKAIDLEAIQNYFVLAVDGSMIPHGTLKDNDDSDLTWL